MILPVWQAVELLSRGSIGDREEVKVLEVVAVVQVL